MDFPLVVILLWVLRVLVAAVFIGMGANHFRRGPARVMASMIPPALRWPGMLRPLNLVYLTGAAELAGGLGILLPQTRLAAALCLTVFLVAVFPANAFAAEHPERFGRAAIPFWPRYAAQLVLIAIILVVGTAG